VLFPCFERGLLTRLRLHTADLTRLAPLRSLFAAEPVAEVVFEVGPVGRFEPTAVRTLPPFPHPVRVSVVRHRTNDAGAQDAFLASLLSSPVLASATALTLDGVVSGRTAAPLVGWLAKSPFLGGVRSLNLARNRVTCADARDLGRVGSLRGVTHLDLTGNVIGAGGRAALAARFGEGVVV
jgi:hypothetical protein